MLWWWLARSHGWPQLICWPKAADKPLFALFLDNGFDSAGVLVAGRQVESAAGGSFIGGRGASLRDDIGKIHRPLGGYGWHFGLLAAGPALAQGRRCKVLFGRRRFAAGLGSRNRVSGSSRQRHNARNVEAAMRELMDFTGYPAERVRRLWSISNQDLARNWRIAGLDGSDAERLAQWYRENSELYMFAISAYNLEYKRIRSNLKVLRFARGSCLDYGAGNGEILLELAGRGHAATYYDVEGVSMNFARWRASQRGLEVEFLHSKEDLAASARRTGFDTVFSFDVLEHLPDLPGELNFLSSLLGRGGLLVFDVPAGSTQSHPMHLNHSLDVCAFALAKGLKDERSLMQRLPFRREEKYFFRAG
jgi:2-polyprenyl-3-methyl-5-hydroxy-6-metoxy-1,4-benzoquinol methylase